MGYRLDLDQQQQLMDEVDLDHSGEVDFDEFLKLLRRYREDEVHVLEKSFHAVRRGNSASRDGCLSAKEIRCLLPALGYNRLSEEQNQLVEREAGGNKELDFRGCVEMMRKLRKCESHDFEEHCFFTPKEEAHWNTLFRKFMKKHEDEPPDAKKVLQEDELRALVVSSFQELMEDSKEAEGVHHMLTGHFARHAEGCDFHQTLELLRMIQDRHSHLVILRENEVGRKAGFTRAEVRDFRKMFVLCDCDATKDVNVLELLNVFSTIVPMAPEIQAELRNIIKTSGKDKNKKKNQKLLFPEFLELISQMRVAAAQHGASFAM